MTPTAQASTVTLAITETPTEANEINEIALGSDTFESEELEQPDQLHGNEDDANDVDEPIVVSIEEYLADYVKSFNAVIADIQSLREQVAAAQLALSAAIDKLPPLPFDPWGAEAFFTPSDNSDRTNGKTVLQAGAAVRIRKWLIAPVEDTDAPFSFLDPRPACFYAEVDVLRGKKLNKRPSDWTHLIPVAELSDIVLAGDDAATELPAYGSVSDIAPDTL